MKVNLEKIPGSRFVAFDAYTEEKINKIKIGNVIEAEIKIPRNYQFHKKVFQFFKFCFEHWKGENEFQSESKQFDVFRKHLTVLAGFYESFYNIKGEVRIEAKSLSYGNMSEEEFQQCYSALINAALKHIFQTTDENTMSHLLSFF